MAARHSAGLPSAPKSGLVDEAVTRVLDVLKADSTLTIKSIRKDVQDRMSDHASVLCNAADVKQALGEARALNENIRQQGIAYSSAPEALKALQWRQTALLSEAVLTALAFYIGRGGGSRGARAICAVEGDRIPEARTGMLEEVSFVSERTEDRAERDSCAIRLRGICLRGASDPTPRSQRQAVFRARLARFPDRRHSRSRPSIVNEGSPA